MECIYELRCLNNKKCYRCYGEALLKLPEDKQRKSKVKKKSHDNAVASSDNSWEDLEATVASKLNQVPTMKEARRTRASGALWFEKGDIVDQIVHPECKERKGRELKSGDKSISIQRSWLEKAKEECMNSNKVMILPFRFKNDDNIYSVMDFEDLNTLITQVKAYMVDNDYKEKEIGILMDEIKELKGRLKKYDPKRVC